MFLNCVHGFLHYCCYHSCKNSIARASSCSLLQGGFASVVTTGYSFPCICCHLCYDWLVVAEFSTRPLNLLVFILFHVFSSLLVVYWDHSYPTTSSYSFCVVCCTRVGLHSGNVVVVAGPISLYISHWPGPLCPCTIQILVALLSHCNCCRLWVVALLGIHSLGTIALSPLEMFSNPKLCCCCSPHWLL